MTEFVDDDGVPDVEGAREHVVGYLVSFVRALRRAGAEVPADASVVAARALAEVGLSDRDAVRAALRSSLISRRADLDAFEQQFPAFWQQLAGEDDEYVAPEQETGSPAPNERRTGTGDTDRATDVETASDDPDSGSLDRSAEPGEVGSGDGSAGETATTAVYSAAGRSRPVTAASHPAEDDRLVEALRRLTDAIASLRGRRWDRGGGDRVDPRRALRRSVGTGGAVLSVPRRERRRSAVRATVLVDVSQSVLDTVDRQFLLDFLRLAGKEWREARVFFFDTSVRDVTSAFDARSTEDAVAALERVEAEWGGGTRIGTAFETVRREHPDAVDRETVAFVVSDGLEVGEVDVLETETSRLSRRAGALLWLNPLATSAEYEPTCRGMAAALPYLDGLFAFAAPDDVDEIARQLERRGIGGRIGYAYDPRRRVGQ